MAARTRGAASVLRGRPAEAADPTVQLATERDQHFVTALARGLQVLRCFSPERPVLGASEIARATGLTQPTVWRLCQTLLALGYLIQHENDRKLRLGLPVLQLGYALLAGEDFRQLARPYMQDIATRYCAGVSFGIRDGSQVLYLQRCIGGSVRLADWTIGSRVAMLESAMGWACLAALPVQCRRSLLEAELADGRPGTDRLLRDFMAALPRYGEKGFVIVQGALSPDASSVAVALRSSDPERILVLSCGGMNDSLNPALLDRIGSELLELSRMLEPVVPTARTTDLRA
jgi:DNA-binding IclR family transcriptional regulator